MSVSDFDGNYDCFHGSYEIWKMAFGCLFWLSSVGFWSFGVY